MKKFWVVWNGKSNATKSHDTEEAAKKEAERLSANSIEKFFVLELVGEYQRPQPLWTEADDV